MHDLVAYLVRDNITHPVSALYWRFLGTGIRSNLCFKIVSGVSCLDVWTLEMSKTWTSALTKEKTSAVLDIPHIVGIKRMTKGIDLVLIE